MGFSRRGHFVHLVITLANLACSFARDFARDEEGQAITEYILILTMTVAGAVTLAKGLLAAINRANLTLGGQLEKDLKTGRADLGLWSN
jgi:Flp pilus assembly pilin Flp